jgi:hypothetical protein
MYPLMSFSTQFLISTNAILTFVGNNFIFFLYRKFMHDYENWMIP